MYSAILVGLLGMAQSVSAPTPVAPAPVARPDVVVEGSKMVCRREIVIGSNIPGKRVCKPKSDVQAEQIAGRDEARRFVVRPAPPRATKPSGAGLGGKRAARDECAVAPLPSHRCTAGPSCLPQ